jgi:hypothetical protein
MDDEPCKMEIIAAQQMKNGLQLVRDDDWADVRSGSFATEAPMLQRRADVRYAANSDQEI